ncbi:TPA: hypothetical protein ACH3X1_001870 [Trebouxia sp. C0004]
MWISAEAKLHLAITQAHTGYDMLKAAYDNQNQAIRTASQLSRAGSSGQSRCKPAMTTWCP